MDRLMFALISDCLSEVRRIPSRCGRETPITVEVLKAHFSPWERGTLINAACFLVDLPDMKIDIPLGAFAIAHRILDAEAAHSSHTADLIAASMAGAPWRGSLDAMCVKCGRLGTWRQILDNPNAPEEIAWRYERPENHLPMCRRCASRLAYRAWTNRFELARAVWGLRFEALLRWHRAVKNGGEPKDWDRGSNPLWPERYGGDRWADGSGALNVSEPRSYYGVERSEKHLASLERMLGVERAEAVVAYCALKGSNDGTDHSERFQMPVETAENYAGALT